ALHGRHRVFQERPQAVLRRFSGLAELDVVAERFEGLGLVPVLGSLREESRDQRALAGGGRTRHREPHRHLAVGSTADAQPGTSLNRWNTRRPSSAAVWPMRSAPWDGPPTRSTASQCVSSRSAIGWKISSNASSPTRRKPAATTGG